LCHFEAPNFLSKGGIFAVTKCHFKFIP
jgi:hypothetical protein